MLQTNFSLKACKLPADELASKNAIFVNFNQLSEIKTKTGAKNKLYAKAKGKILEICGAQGVDHGGGGISK